MDSESPLPESGNQSRTLQTDPTTDTDPTSSEQEPQGPVSSNPRVASLSRGINHAVAAGDHQEARKLMDSQLGEIMRGLNVDEFVQQPGDPVLWNDAMRDSNEHVALRAHALQFARQAVMTGQILQDNNWSEISSYGQSIVDRFKDRNKTPLLKEHPGMTMDERVQLSQQLTPIQLDPNEVANYRQRLVKIDQQLKTVGSSVFTDPRTSRIAKIINTETEPATPGYGVSGPQDIIAQMPLHERMLMPVRQGFEAFVGAAAQTGYGAARALERMGFISLDAMTGGNGAAHYNQPTAWVQDADGSWYHNGGKVGAAELYAGVWHMLTGQLIDQQMADYGNTAAVAAMNQTGVRSLATGIAHFLGSTTAFLATGGPAMRGGQLVGKGLGWLATGGRAAASLGRAKAIVSSLGLVGSAAGLGAYEAVQNGHIEGYGAAFANGAIMAAPMMLIGQLGRSTERLLMRTDKMPARLAAAISGAAEGTAFAGMDWHPIWNFIQDPNPDTRGVMVQHVLINMLGMSALKGAGAPTPGELANLRLPSKDVLDRNAGAEAEAKANAGRNPPQAAVAIEQMRETESEIRQQQTGLDKPFHEAEQAKFDTEQKLKEIGPAEENVKVEATKELIGEHEDPLDSDKFSSLPEGLQIKLAKTEELADRIKMVQDYYNPKKDVAPKEEGIKFPSKEELDAVRQMQSGPGKNAKITQLLKASSEKFGQAIAKSAENIGKQKAGEEEEITTAAKLVRNLMGSEAKKPGLTEEPTELAVPQPPRAKVPGEPGSLRMSPTLEEEGIPGTPRTRASDVILELQGFKGDPVRTPIREGTRGPFTKPPLGFYNTVEKIIRLKGERDTIAAVHEWGHAMDAVANSGIGANKPFRSMNSKEKSSFLEAAAKWYPGFKDLTPNHQRAEAWAEFWARFMLDDPTLKDETQPAYDKLMKWLADPAQTAIRNQMQRSQQVLRNYRDQGAKERGRASMVMHDDPKSIQELQSQGIMKDTPPAKAAGLVRKVFRILNQQMIADNASMKRAMQERMEIATGSKEAAKKAIEETPIQDNPVRLFDALRMTANKIVERFILHGTQDLSGNVTGEGLKKIFDDVGDGKHEDFLNYLNAKRNLEVNAKGLETLLDPSDYRAIVRQLESPEFELGAKRIREWSDRLIDYATEGGLFSFEQAKDIKSSYQTYIPFFRVMMDRPRRSAPGRGVAERGTGVKTLHGADLEIKDPVDALGDMARSVITKTQQNMVMKSMVKFGLRHGATGGLITKVERDILPDTHPIKQIMDELQKASEKDPDLQLTLAHIADRFGDMVRAGEIGGSLTMFSQAVMPKGSKPIIAFTPHFTDADIKELPTLFAQGQAERMNHTLQWYEVDVDTYDMLMGVDQPQMIIDKLPAFIQAAIDIPSKALRAGATVLAPGFVARNIVRDTATFYLYSEESMPLGIFSAAGKAIATSLEVMKGSPELDLFENIGGKGTTYFAGEIAAGRTAAELLGRERSVKNIIKHAYGKLADMLGTGEEVLRFRAFKTARDNALKNTNASEFEANMLGLEAAKEITANFTRAGVLARVLNRMVPYFTASIAGSARFAKTLGGAYGASARSRALIRGMVGIGMPAMALWWLNQDKKWFRELPDYERFNFLHLDLGLGTPLRIPLPFEIGKVFAKIPELILEQAHRQDPIGVSNTMMDVVQSFLPSQWMPSIMRPLVEGISNHDFFTGKDIVPAWMRENRKPIDQQTAYTRWYGKMVAQALGFVGYDISPMMAEHQIDRFTGGIVGRTEDLATTMAQLAGVAHGEVSPSRIPIAGSFLTEPFRQSRSVDQLFKLSADVEQRIGSAKAAGQHPAAQDHQLHQQLQRAKQTISDLMQRAREGTMPRSEANERAADLARNFLSRVNQ
jgi:hypothetical protein